MPRFWSETPASRSREVATDLATWAWVALWVAIGARIHGAIAGFAEAGRAIGQGGRNIQSAGADLGGALSNVPVVGEGARDLAVGSFRAAGDPFVYVGAEIVELVLFVATLLALVVVVVMLVPWLSRYVPWRARRLATLRAAHCAIRTAPVAVASDDVERILASRAIHRLSYPELLEHSPDPVGDFARGRFDRLARAELESVGLRPRPSRRSP